MHRPGACPACDWVWRLIVTVRGGYNKWSLSAGWRCMHSVMGAQVKG